MTRKTAHAVRDSVLSVLTQHVRLLSSDILATKFYAHTKDPVRAARKAIATWHHSGLVDTDLAVLPPLITPTAPLYDSAAMPEPNFDQLSYIARTRAGTPSQLVLFWPTAETHNAYGTTGKMPRAKEFNHDRQLAWLHFHFAEHHPTWQWTHEDKLGCPKDQRPDAIINTGSQTIAIEWAGAYSASQIRTHVMQAAANGQRIQIW